MSQKNNLNKRGRNVKEPKSEVGKRIRELQQESGMTTQAFAEFLKISVNTLNAWIYGVRNPAPYVVEYMELKLEKLKEQNKRITLKRD